MIQELIVKHIFRGRPLVIATMHKKEIVIAPLITKELGVKYITIPALDTDVFGSFSGEVERTNTPMQTARLKALAALKFCDATLAIASEGSFGNHPSSIFLSANEEIVILIDIENQLEITGRYLTMDTNNNRRKIKSMQDLEEFKTEIGYPEHAIILKIENLNSKDITIYKDFKSSKELEETVCVALETNLLIEAETDMRAMNNPTRMKAIECAMIDLIKNIQSICPKCQTPGFTIQLAIPGLPCEMCHSPTKSIKAFKYECQKCNFSEIRIKEGPSTEDAMFCDLCNP